MEIHENIPIGSLDKDSDNRYIKPENYRRLKNMRKRTTPNGSVVLRPLKGNVLIPFDLPDGDNTCIGAFHDKQNQSVIYFNHNSDGNHGIYQYRAGIGVNGEVREVIQYDFRWTSDTKITSVNLVDGNLLYWIDNVLPRKINIDKAIFEGKRICYKVYFGNDDDYNSPRITVIDLLIHAKDGTQLFNGSTAIATQFLDRKGFIQKVVDKINSTWPLEAESCGEYMKIYDDVGGYFFSLNVGTTGAKVVPDNWYGVSLIDRFFDMYKWQPPCDPKVEYKKDDLYDRNNVKLTNWQFRCQYIYDDNEPSKLGPISCVPINNLNCGERDVVRFNYIQVDFNDDANMFDERTWVLLKRVNVLAREGNDGAWRVVDELGLEDIYNISAPLFRYDFYNDTITAPVDDILATALQDRLPKQCNAMRFIENRMVLGGSVDGFDVPECLKGSINVRLNETTNRKLYNIRGKIRIANWQNVTNVNQAEPSGAWFSASQSRKGAIVHITDSEGNQQPYPVFGGIPGIKATAISAVDDQGTNFGQDIPLGNFLVYAAGTEYAVKATQIGSDLPQSNDGVIDIGADESVDDVQDYLVNNDIYSLFSMRVPPGTYVLRIASHWVSFGDVMGKGKDYDLSNGIGYQRTSTNVKGIREANGVYQRGVYEIVVTVVDQDVNAGEFVVEDLSNITGTNSNAKAVSGYLIDTKGDLNSDDFGKNASYVEQQLVRIKYFGNSGGGKESVSLTDHNGHWAGRLIQGNGDFFGPNDSIKASGYDTRYYKSANQRGVVSSVDNLIEVSQPKPSGYEEMMLVIEDPDFFQDNSTLVTGQIVGSTSGNMVITRTGRSGRIDLNGNFSVLTFKSSVINVRPELLVFSDFFGCVTDLSVNPNPIAITFNAPTYSVGSLNIVIQEYSQITKSLKRGGKYEVGLREKDQQGRVTSVIPIGEFVIPHYHEDPLFRGPATVTVNIDPSASPEAHHYDLMLSENLNQGLYIQWSASDVKYLNKYDFDTEGFSETSYESGQANMIAFDMQSINEAFKRNYQNNVPFDFAKGDRVLLLIDSQGDYYNERYEFEVVHVSADNELVVEIDNPPLIEPGTLIEVFKPKKLTDDKIFYEIGECFPTTAPGTQNNQYSQTSIQLECGDTFNRRRLMRSDDGANIFVRLYTIEANTTSDIFGGVVADWGRIGVVDLDFKELYRPTSLRVSGTFKADTEINLLSTYEDLTDKELDRDLGEIQRLEKVGDNLLVILTNRIASIYVSERILSSQEALNELLVQSDLFLGSDRNLLGDYGTQHPESIYTHDDRVYGYDQYKSVIWRYSRDGLTIISDYGIKSTIKELPDQVRVIGVVDDYNDEYQIVFDRTLAYDIISKGWCSDEYSYIPEMMMGIRDQVVAFFNGQCYLQEANPVVNNFFGVQYDAEIEVVANTSPGAPKVWMSMTLESDSDNWRAYDINNDLGQQTRIVSFRRKEQNYHASMKRDLNSAGPDPIVNGKDMRSTTLNINLRNNSTQDFFLRSIRTAFNISPKV